MSTRLSCLLGSAALALTTTAVAAQDAEDSLRVCASTEDAPYSTADQDGFENRIAEVIAEEAGMTLELVMIDQPGIFLFRDGIDAGTCDVLMGIDENDDRLLVSEPYYRSGYAFVSREDRDFQGEKWEDVDQEGYETFAYRYYTPAETILKYTGRYEYNLVYQASLTNFTDRRNQYTQVPARLVVSEVADGNADLGIIFAPDAGRYVRDSRTPLRMTLITNDIERSDGVIIPLQFNQAVGVSKDRPELLETVQDALNSGQDRIEAILDEEGIPTLPLDKTDKDEK